MRRPQPAALGSVVTGTRATSTRSSVRAVATLLALVALVVASLMHVGVASAAANPRSDRAVAVATSVLSDLATQSDQNDPQWYANGVWHAADTSDWTSFTAPASLAAQLYVSTGRSNPTLLAMAVDTFDHAIANYGTPSGLFGNPSLPSTQFFVSELATTYLTLGTSLDAAHRTAWKAAIAGGADALIANGELAWATNGNVDLGETFVMQLVYQVTGDQKYQTAFEQAWSFLLAPPQDKFPGFGLQITRAPTLADGSDGAGYLAEKGSGAPGYDPEYTALQLSIADRAYVFSGDPRFRWLANLLFNQLRPRLDTSTWVLDASNGSRHSVPSEGFTSPAPAVLGFLGGRTDLAPLADDALEHGTYSALLSNAKMNWGSPGLYRASGMDLALALKVALLTSAPYTPPPSAPWIGVPAIGAAATTATVWFAVNPDGAATSAYVEYGATTTYSAATTPVAVGSGRTIVNLIAKLTALPRGSKLHFRVVAVSALGLVASADQTFTTSP